MGQLVVSDNASSILAASISSSPAVTTLVLADASKFPVINHGGAGSDWSYVTLFDAANNIEKVKVTRRDNASNTVSIVRGTAAGIVGVTDADCKAWSATTTGVACRLIAQTVNDIGAQALAAAASAAASAASAAAAATDAADAEAAVETRVLKVGGKFTAVGGSEGGQVEFEKPASGTILATDVSVDVDTNLLRVFATVGVAVRQASLDFNKMADGDQKFITFPAGTRMLFAQATAPVGWTQDTSDNANNRMLRVVAGAGNGVGGSHSPILNNVVPAHTHGFTTGGISANHNHSGNTGYVSNDHTHGVNDPGHAHTVNAYSSSDNGGTLASGNAQWYAGAFGTSSVGTGIWLGGISANHYHAFTTGTESQSHTHSGTTDNGSSQTNWTPRYLDLIVCSKD